MNILNMQMQDIGMGWTPAWGLGAGQTTNNFKNLTCYTIFDKISDLDRSFTKTYAIENVNKNWNLECDKLYRPGSCVFISSSKGIAYLIVPCFAVSISTRPHIQPSVYSN